MKNLKGSLRHFTEAETERLKTDLYKVINRHRPAAMFVCIFHDAGDDAVVAGVHENAVAIMRPLGRRMMSELQAIHEKLQQDYPSLDAVPREVIDKVVDETTRVGVDKVAETPKVH